MPHLGHEETHLMISTVWIRISRPFVVALICTVVGTLAVRPAAQATVRPPVSVDITSMAEVFAGQETTVLVVIRGADFPHARFDLLLPAAGWTLVGGDTSWEGSLIAGEAVSFSARVIPELSNPEPLHGWLSLDGWPDTEWLMDMNGPPEDIGQPSAVDGAAMELPDDTGSIAASATVTAKGRFVYTDDHGNTVGIRHAIVQMYDNDFFFPCAPTFGVCRQLMGTGQTDDNGNFEFQGTGGDALGDLPDPYVIVVADSAAVAVQTAGLINSTYCFKSFWKDNAKDEETVNYGDIFPGPKGGCAIEQDVTGENGAWHIYNTARRAWETMRVTTMANPGRSGMDTGGEIPKVRVFWPDSLPTFYRPGIPGVDDGGITLNGTNTWNEAILIHEYGHHVLYHFAESPIPDYNNATCDTAPFLLFGGHCVWQPEKGAIHWTEGWPDFFS